MKCRVGMPCVPDIVKNQALAGVKRDANVPFLPLEQIALHHETGAFRLHDIQRLQVCAPLLFHQIAVVVDIAVGNVGRGFILLIDAHDLQSTAQWWKWASGLAGRRALAPMTRHLAQIEMWTATR